MSNTQTKTRRRVIATGTEEKKPTAELVALAALTLAHNTAANKAKAAYDKARKALLKRMKDDGFREFSATALLDGKTVAFDATISANEREVIDVAKLRKITTDDVFIACVSATKASVEAAAGKAVITQCAYTVKGEENVSVKPSK